MYIIITIVEFNGNLCGMKARLSEKSLLLFYFATISVAQAA